MAPRVVANLIPSRPRAVIASAARSSSTSPDPGAARMKAPWQTRAFAYYDTLGEVWYASQFYARALTKLELVVMDVSDPSDPEPADDPNVTALLDRIQDPGGGRSNLLGAYGRLRFLTGECYLLATTTDDGVEEWEMLSCDELRWDSDAKVYKRFRSPNAKPEQYGEADDDAEPLPGEAQVWRLWQRHPRYSNDADGPMRGVLDLCEELLLLTRAVRARSRSRAAGSGILFVPDEVTFTNPDGSVPPEDADEDLFLEMLTTAMTTPIADEGSASAVVPLVVRVAEQFIDRFRHLKLLDPTEVYPETGLRMECIQRIALGLDLPPEILLGKADANHWSAWQIDEDSWKAHLEPIARQLVDDLTAAYLRPTLAAMGLDPNRYAIGYDASAIIIHPDRGRDAKDLHDRLVISDDSLREAAGFDENDAPEDDEYNRRVGVRLGDAALATSGELAPTPEPEPEPEPVEAPTGEAPGAVEPGPPVVAGGAANLPLLQAAAQMMVERSRELAGSRIRSHLQKDRPTLALIDGVHNRDVAPTLSLAGRFHDYDAPQLVAGACECYAGLLGQWGIGAAEYAALEQVVARHAARTLVDSDPPRLSPGLG